MSNKQELTPKELAAQADALLAAADAAEKAGDSKKTEVPRLDDKQVAALPAASWLAGNEKLRELLAKGKKKGKPKKEKKPKKQKEPKEPSVPEKPGKRISPKSIVVVVLFAATVFGGIFLSISLFAGELRMQSAKEAFESEGIMADVAYNGREGLAKFHENDYDLILLDLKMPLMTGEELLKVIRSENPYIEIIVYTNFTEYGDIKKLINLGINGYVNKGAEAELDELIDIVKSKLEPLGVENTQRLLQSTVEIRG